MQCVQRKEEDVHDLVGVVTRDPTFLSVGPFSGVDDAPQSR